ncbi:hypothetical protein QFZ20_000764 [Flavobacterium sp. W4I14]|nr:hypothetical protein [Flavobacterium sp. W4I14]
MKTIFTMVLSVMIFTGAMAQQKVKEVSLQTKAKEQVDLNKQSAEGSQSASTKASLNTQKLKSKVKEKKNDAQQKSEAIKEAINEKATNAEASSTGKVGTSGTVGGSTHGLDVSTTAQSDVTIGKKGAVVSKVASVNGQVNGAVKDVKTDANVKTDVKVKTDVNVNPKSINTKVKAATGIKL